MAHFGTIDLHDYVLNGLRLEDDSGICMSTLDESRRRCRPGGLPILGYPESFDDSPPKSEYHINVLDPQTSGFREPLGIPNNQTKPRFSRVIYCPETTLYGSSKLPSNFDYKYDRHFLSKSRTSITSLVEPILNRPFDNYARFNYYYDPENAKSFKILYTFAHDSFGMPFRQSICINPEATIADLVGLAMQIFTLKIGIPPADHVDDYAIYLAEDDKADTDFPKLSPYTKAYKTMFDNLAIVLRADMPSEPSVLVVVYFTTGQTYQIEVDSKDTPLHIIHQEAMRRKNIEAPDIDAPNTRFTKEYVVEAIDKAKVNLDLNATIAQCGCYEFVMLLKNSARGNFMPQRVHFKKPGVIDTIEEESSASVSSTDLSGAKKSVVSPSSTNHVVEEYAVDRLHKFRPKWPATISIRHDAVEICPASIEKRRNIVSQSTQKLTYLDYDAVGSVWLGGDRMGGRRHIKLVYIDVAADRINEFYTALTELNTKERELLKAGAGNQKNDRQDSLDSSSSADTIFRRSVINALLEHTRWKTMALDAKEADGWNIVAKLNAILDSRFSYIKSLYDESKNGTRSPVEAAAHFNKDVFPNLSDSLNSPLTPTGKPRRKFTIPRLTRMLSKQE